MASVRSASVEELAVEVTADAVTGEPQVDVVWKDDRLDATVGGRSKALIETHNVIIPDQRDAIAGVADELRAVVNGVHMAGYDEAGGGRSEEHTSELQSLMRRSYAVFCLKKKKVNTKLNKVDSHCKH